MRKNRMRKMAAIFGLLLGAGVSHPAQAAITVDKVLVGDAGNSADTTSYGAVAYTYSIGKYEVTIGQYTSFLNAVAATDTYSLYNTSMGTDTNVAGISRSGSSGSYTYAVIGSANCPITFVNWFDAARFANWMANGQTTGAQGATTTENGAYTLNGAESGVITKNETNPNTGQATTWWIPSEDEWYKAAYYKGGGTNAGYWLYPTQSDTIAGNTIGVADSANYYNGNFAKFENSLPTFLSDVGAYGVNSASFYGTYDQAGNVWEWNDAVIDGGSSRGIRGGSWGYAGDVLPSTYRSSNSSFGPDNFGFRLAGVEAVPEPSSGLLLLLGGAACWVARRRAKKIE